MALNLTLIALMTDIASIIQRASFVGLYSQALLTSIRSLWKLCFAFCLRVKSGNAKLSGADITGYQNATSRFTSSSRHYSKLLPINFHNWNCFRNFLGFLQFYAMINPLNRVKKISFSLHKTVIYETASTFHLQFYLF